MSGSLKVHKSKEKPEALMDRAMKNLIENERNYNLTFGLVFSLLDQDKNGVLNNEEFVEIMMAFNTPK